MREWQVGDPIDGNEIGVPDIPYMDYLKERNNDEYGDNYSNSYSLRNNYSYDDYVRFARESSKNGDYAEAVKYYDLANGIFYRDEVMLEKADCLIKLGKKVEAGRCYYDVASRYTFGDSDKTVAVKYYKKAVYLNPHDEESLSNLGYVLKELHRFNEALTYYEKIKDENVDWEKAMCHMGLNQYSKALPLLDNCFKESPFRDDFFDQKCECLIKLNKKDEVITEHKRYVIFLMKKECYQSAIKQIENLSKIAPDDSFIDRKRDECIKNKAELEQRLQRVLDAIGNYHMYNPNGLDENDLKGFMEFVSQQSGESVEDILRWYNLPMLDDFEFHYKCLDMLHYSHWIKILKMYGMWG